MGCGGSQRSEVSKGSWPHKTKNSLLEKHTVASLGIQVHQKLAWAGRAAGLQKPDLGLHHWPGERRSPLAHLPLPSPPVQLSPISPKRLSFVVLCQMACVPTFLQGLSGTRAKLPYLKIILRSLINRNDSTTHRSH